MTSVIDNLKKIYKKNNFSLNTTAVNNFKKIVIQVLEK
jgi:hypothetical protein